jgi:hypothetical protein
MHDAATWHSQAVIAVGRARSWGIGRKMKPRELGNANVASQQYYLLQY